MKIYTDNTCMNHYKFDKLECFEKIFGEPSPKEPGSWKDSGMLTIIRETGILYSSSPISPITTPSSFSKITEVVWKLNITNYQNSLKIFLCDIHQHPGWLDISSHLSGRTKAFNNRCANHHFKLYFYVLGNGVLDKTIYAQLDSIDIVWD